MKTFLRCILAVLLFAMHIWYFTSTTIAQSTSTENQGQPFHEKALERFKARDIREDFLIPTSPAFAVLGVTPEEVIRPDTPKALGTALLNGVDPNGNLQSGIAIDFSPYYLFAGRNLSLRQYRDSYATRVASRLQVSLATTKGSDDDESLRLALGFRLALLDKADPRTSTFLDTCYDNDTDKKLKELEAGRNEAASLLAPLARKGFEIEAARRAARPDNEVVQLRNEETQLMERRTAALQKVATLQAQAEEVLKQIWTECNKEFEKAHWNATNFTLGVAPIFISKDGDFGALAGSGVAVYGTFSYGFDGIPGLEDSSQIVLHARYRNAEQVAVPNVPGRFIKQDVVLVGVQLRIAGPNIGGKVGGRDLAFFGEFDYRLTNRDGLEDDTIYRFALGIEYKLIDNVTLGLIVGDESGDDTGTSGAFVVGSLKWGF